MSGFEIAGVILGVIPLVISAVEDYKASKGALASMLQWKVLLSHLTQALLDQKLAFHLDIVELLRLVGVEEVVNRSGIPSEEECVQILRKMTDSDEMKEFFDSFHNKFLEILRRYESRLKTIVTKLTHIVRPHNAKEDDYDLSKILAINDNGRGGFGFTKSINFTIRRSELRDLIAQLRDDRQCLKILIDAMQKHQEYNPKPTRKAAQLAQTFRRVKASIAPLFAAMREVCTCDCSNGHKVLLQLESRMPLQDKKRRHVQTIFSLVLELNGDLQEALVNASRTSYEPEVEVSAKCSTFDSRRIKFLLPKVSNAETATVRPFVEQVVKKSQAKRPNTARGPDPKPVLIELAILLLEIWNHKPLEMWMGRDTLDSEGDRMLAAVKWLQTSNNLSEYHCAAIEGCLRICSSRLQDWKRDEFLVEYCENVIKPLRESCKAW
ncbi:hypothetical protein F4813DRAFT_398914 [Daldinia decipiens]|uniref:uncharacterized protein n=1 Tax=Daldinia decipiens TaxID=326647 RepID=UPI0020C21A44|nr:uncharacterized protein F4813DRAFT_398914 [Daldinia decipiens]KAI1654574.1 hypothetical protein F4813DRAFT_398914 [Daldinia decipiens]